MNADRQSRFVGFPQILKDQLGKRARVAEHQRGAVRLDLLHHLRCGIAPRMPRPGDMPLWEQDADVRLGPRLTPNERHRIDVAVRREPGAIGVGIGDRRR
mgnify:CR=1 FL=1